MLQQRIIFDIINHTIVFFTALLIIYTIKGFCKASMSYILGDNTAKNDGFLTLNPLVHLNIVGLGFMLVFYACVAILLPEFFPRSSFLIFPLIFGIQWSIPLTLNPRNFKNQTLGVVLVALSGIIGLILTAFLLILLLKTIIFLSTKYSIAPNVITTVIGLCSATIDFSLWFALFNLIPFPPLDGGIILRQLLPYNQQYIADWLEEYSLYLILLLFFFPGVKNIFLGNLNYLVMLIKKTMLSLV